MVCSQFLRVRFIKMYNLHILYVLDSLRMLRDTERKPKYEIHIYESTGKLDY